MLVYACVCNMYSHRSVNVPPHMSSQTYVYKFTGSWSCWLDMLCKTHSFSNEAWSKDTHLCNIQSFETQITGSQLLISGENEGYHLSAVLYFSWTMQPEHLGSECFSGLENPNPWNVYRIWMVCTLRTIAPSHISGLANLFMGCQECSEQRKCTTPQHWHAFVAGISQFVYRISSFV